MSRSILPLLLASVAVSGCADNSLSTSTAPASPTSTLAPQASGTLIAGRYIVGFKSNVADVDIEARRLELRHRGVLRMTYKSALKGMTLTMSAAAADSLRDEPNVAFVEQDRMSATATTQSGASWGIDRTDQRGLPLNNAYSYSADGSGVTVYILDSGINFTHSDFGGRASAGTDIMTPGGTAADCHGHGSTVSGVVAGSTYGVAKKAKLVAVRVVDCNGNSANSTTIAGIDWVTSHRVLPAVANLSLQNVYSAALNQSIANAVAAGVTFVVAAGNSSADACSASPSSAPSAIVVGATDMSDAFASFSNYGSCVTMLAPGVNIPGPSIGSNSATKTWSGTSFASPHVAGLAALYLQTHPTATPAQVRSYLLSNATPSAIKSVPSGTPNLLAYSPQTISTNQAPNARFTASCLAMQCTFDATSATDDAGIVSYAWNWGNGRSETRSTPITKNTFATQATYSITLTATDAGGLTNSVTKQVAVPTTQSPPPPPPPPPTNHAPVARFTFSCANPAFPHQCSFDGSTSTDDVKVVSYKWDWGNGRSEARNTPTTRNTWAASGTYNITLTVTDGAGLTSSLAKSVVIP
ncbi:MAG: serine protease [Gemmatimonadetes bacterium]|nr:serine protease [Gemmatimonadota bacterium]